MRLPERSADLASLGDDVARNAESLAAKAISAHRPTGTGPAHPDEMSYAITIDDGASVTVISESESSMTEEFSELLDWLDGVLSGGP